MKLFQVHCGYYDPSVCGGQYEFHVNFFAAGLEAEAARASVKKNSGFLERHMHIDGIQEIEAVDGYRITLELSGNLNGETVVKAWSFRELSPHPIKLT